MDAATFLGINSICLLAIIKDISLKTIKKWWSMQTKDLEGYEYFPRENWNASTNLLLQVSKEKMSTECFWKCNKRPGIGQTHVTETFCQLLHWQTKECDMLLDKSNKAGSQKIPLRNINIWRFFVESLLSMATAVVLSQRTTTVLFWQVGAQQEAASTIQISSL